MIRLALIGCHDTADQYAAAASRLSNVTVTAANLDESLAAYADSFDAVVMRVTGETDLARCLEAVAAGKHVLIEPPLAPSLEFAETISAACRAAGVRIMTGLSDRFVPGIQTVKQSIDSGSLGEPGLLRIHRWETCDAHARGLLPQHLIADIDLATWMFGCRPMQIYAVSREAASRKAAGSANGVTDFVQLHLGFPDGGMALIDVATSMPDGDSYYSLSMIGSTGAAYADDHHNMQLLYRGGRPSALKIGQGCRHLTAQLQEFASAIADGREPSANAADWRTAICVADAVATSLSTGHAVHDQEDTYAAV